MNKQLFGKLAREAGVWQQDDLIEGRQAPHIPAHYRQPDDEDGHPNRFVHVLSLFGALLIGVGVITFFASNWQAIPGWLKLVMVCSAFIASYAAGFRLRFGGTGLPGVGNALIMLGALLYGASIFLVAQGFHVRADEPTLLYLWAAGILPVASLLSSPGLLTIALLSLSIGLGWELEAWSFFERGNPLPCIGLYLAFGLLLCILGELHRSDHRYRALHRPYTVIGVFIVSCVLYSLSFYFVWDSWSYGGEELLTLASPPVQRLWLLIVSSIGVAAFYWWKQTSTERPIAACVSGVILTLSLLAAGLFFYHNSPTKTYSIHNIGSFPPESIVFNLVMFLWSFGLVALGYHQQRRALVSLGIWFFGIQLLARYIDLIWAMLPTSIAFIGAGIILLVGGALLERTRRRILN